MESTLGSTQNSQERQRAVCVALAERMMRCLASAALVWSLAGLAYLYWIVSDQPQRFLPLVIRESDIESDRIAAIDAWRVSNIPSNTEPLLGYREPLRLYQLDSQLSLLPGKHLGAKERSFQDRLFELNVGVEEFCTDYWSSVWRVFEFGIPALLASMLRIAFPRILSSSLFLLIAGYPGLYQLAAWWRSEIERQSLLWSAPLLGTAMACLALAIFRWRIAPNPTEVTNNWNKLWLGLLLILIGAGAFYVLIAWGGRTRSNGLAGIGLSFGWGVYLVAKHGWKLLQSLLGRSTS